MFKYNELSDLLNGELVVPIKKENDNIICLNSKNEEVIYSFDDFDFEKTIEERDFIVQDDSSEEIEEDLTQEEIEKQPIISPEINRLNNLLNVTIKNWTNRDINLVGDISLPSFEEITIDVFEDSPIYLQLQNLYKKLIISFEVNSISKKVEVVPEKVYFPVEDSHFSKEPATIATMLGYKVKDSRKVKVWTDVIN